jgi:ABC-type transporter Mla subunit MlaD
MRSAAQRAIENVRECGAQMGTRARALRAASPGVRMAAAERNRTLELCDQLSAVSGEVAAGVAGLDAVNATSAEELQEVLRTLSTLEAEVMQVLAAFTSLVDSLEQAAERDEANEPAYSLVIDAAAGMLNSFEKAKSATEALREMLSGRD